MLRKLNIFLLSLLIVCPLIRGQNDNNHFIDSISDLPDTIKLNLLHEKALKELSSSLATSLEYAEEHKRIALAINNIDELARNWHLTGNLYMSANLTTDAMTNYQEAYHLYDSLGNNDGVASILHNLGLVAHIKNDTAKTIYYYTRSVNFRKENLSSKRIADELVTLGEAYLSFRDYDISRTQLQAALNYYNKDGIKNYKRKTDGFAYLFDACIASKNNNCKHWIDSMQIANQSLKSDIYDNMIKLRLSKYYLSVDSLDLSASYTDSIDFSILYNIEVLKPHNILKIISEKYLDANDHINALIFRELYREIDSDYADWRVRKLVGDYKTRLGIRESEEEIKLRNEQNRIVLQKIKIEKTISLLIYLAIGITLLMMVYILYNLSGISNANKQLALRNRNLKEAYERSTRYKERILNIRENKNIFFTIVSLKLKEPFIKLSSRLSDVNDYLAKNSKDLRLKRMITSVYNEASAIEKALKRVLLWSKLQRNKYEIEREAVKPYDYFHEILPEILGNAIKKDIKIRFDVDPDLEIVFDRSSLKSILKIFTENSVENSPPGSDIIIRAQKSKTGSIISVTDFGSGIPASIQNNIFEISRLKENESSNKSLKLGLGLLIAKTMAEKNNSVLSYESKENAGTTFFVHIKNNYDRE